MKPVIIITIAFVLLIPTSVYAEEIPSWIKANAGWWADGQIDDETFIQGIQFLIRNEVIVIPQTQQGISESQEIPLWVRNNAGWWADGQIDDETFIQGIQFLIKEGIVEINQKFDKNLINFAITGDLAVNSNTKKNLKNIEKVNPEVILFVGDLRNDVGTPTGFFSMTEFLGEHRINIAFGNHDYEVSFKNQYLEYYDLSETFYSFDYDNVHFIVLDTESTIVIDSDQFQFLVNDLQNTKNNPDVDWIIVGLHKPIYSDGKHTKVRDPSNLIDIEHMVLWRTIVQPLFDYYNVDLVLQAHNQFYERFKPLTFDSIVTEDNSPNYVDPQGQIYLTVGTGGHKLHQNTEKSNLSEIQTDQHFGFLNLKFTSDGRTLNGEFVSLDEEIIDKFQIVKQKSKLASSINNFDLSSPNKDFSNNNLFLYDFANADLSYADLENTILTYADLSNADLTGANLRGTNLQGTNLSGIDLSGMDLTGANLSFQNLSLMNVSSMILDHSILYQTTFEDNDFSGKNLSGLNLKASAFRFVDFSYADLSFSHLTNSYIDSSNFLYTNLENAYLNDSFINNVDFSTSNISGVNFNHAYIVNSNFRNTDLKDIDFSNARISNSILDFQDLRHVNMTNTVLSPKLLSEVLLFGASLIEANLSNMDLRSVIFARTDLTLTPDNVDWRSPTGPTNLSGANLSGTNLSEKNKSAIDNLVGVVFYGTNLSNSNLSESDLSFADLRFADLSDSKLNNANLSGANLSGANLSGANLSGTILEGTILDCMHHSICN